MRTTLQVLRTVVLVTGALAVGGSLAAQGPTRDRLRKRSHRIFAAQTGPDQVTLAWDEVPGATEYRVYLPDPNRPGPPAPGTRPYTTLSGSGRQVGVTGVRRMAAGAYLEAVAKGQVLYRGTFNAVTRAPLTPVTPPSSVQAQETGETEVTVTWPTVPGATAYMIMRAAGGSGWGMACNVCPPSGEFVDTTALPGVEHAYAVAAIFPQGISERTSSNELTVGAAQLAAATAASQAAAAVTWDKPMSSGTPVAGTDADNTNVGASGGTPTTSPPTGGTPTGTGTPTTGTGTPTTGTGTPTTGTGTPTTGTGTPTYTPPGTPGYTPPGTPGSTLPGTPTGGTSTPTTGTPTTGTATGLQPPTQVSATVTGVAAGSAWISWTPPPSAGVTGYVLYRSINGASFSAIKQLGMGVLGYADTTFSRLLFASGPVMASYYLAATGMAGVASGPSNVTAQVQIQQPSSTGGVLGGILGGITDALGGSSSSTHTSTPAPGPTPTPPATLPSCKLDYQRADNMWAAAGRPDGNLGVETIAQANGQTKVFITDWAYEKRTNDGTNYYGSHLRIATNTGAGVVALRLNNPTSALFGNVSAALANKLGIGALAGFVIMNPGDKATFRDDLREVRCGQ